MRDRERDPMKLCNDGITRHVLLVGRWAIKVPRVTYGWRKFLCGLLCNQDEALWGRSKLHGICPCLFAIPGGWLIVQPRARVMTEAEFAAFDYKQFVTRREYIIPAEKKADSFGWLNDQIVAIDVGEIRLA